MHSMELCKDEEVFKKIFPDIEGDSDVLKDILCNAMSFNLSKFVPEVMESLDGLQTLVGKVHMPNHCDNIICIV